MNKHIRAIYAFGKQKEREHVRFDAIEEPGGGYALHRKVRSATGNSTNKAENKVLVASLDEAAALVRSGEFLISLKPAKGPRSLRDHKRLVFEEA